MDILKQWLRTVTQLIESIGRYPSNCSLEEATWRAFVGPLEEDASLEPEKMFAAFEAWKKLSWLLPSIGPVGFARRAWVKAKPHLPSRVNRFLSKRLDNGVVDALQVLMNKSDAAAAFERAFNQVSRGRRFCVTECGYIGWAPPDAGEGDEVIACKGTRTLFVVRSSSNNAMSKGPEATASSDPDARTLVGAMWLYGLMNGEALSRQELQETTVILL
jgi:hypothetical protein